jgi:protein gp37
MADGTGIEWAEATWNPITGCSVASAGCKFCYAMKLAGTRLKNHPSRVGLTVPSKNGPVWNGEVRFNPQWLDQPVHRARPRVHFVCAHSDLFHPAVPDEWRDKCYAVMAAAHWHIFIVLTKRPEIAAEYWRDQDARAHAIFAHREATPAMKRVGWSWAAEDMPWPLPNIWHGTSIEDQRHADERLPPLFEIPSALYWASVEPMLGPVSLREWLYPIGEAGVIDRHALGWVVAGGEVWRRWYDGTEKWSIEEYSMALADGAVPVQYADVGKKNAGRRLDGETWSQMPKQLGWALQEAA